MKKSLKYYRLGQKSEATNSWPNLNRYKKKFITGRFTGKFVVNWLSTIPPFFA